MQCIGAWYVYNPTLGQYNPVACTSLSPCCTQALGPLFFTAGHQKTNSFKATKDWTADPVPKMQG